MTMDAITPDLDNHTANPVDVGGRPSLDDIAARAIEVANERQADREAGRKVSDTMPDVMSLRRSEGGRLTLAPTTKDPAPSLDDAPAPHAPSAPPLPAPADWSEPAKADFARLPSEAQKLVLQRADEQSVAYNRKAQEFSERVKVAAPIVEAYRHHAEFLDLQSRDTGLRPEQIMSNLIQIFRVGTTGQPHERAQALGFVANAFNVDLRAAARGEVVPRAASAAGWRL